MSVIKWNDSYSVDIQEIDEQHKKLVDLINQLYTALSSRQRDDEIRRVLAEVVDYTKIHFAVEECLLRIFEYPDYEAHKAIHDRIVQKVTAMQAQFIAGNQGVGMELLLFLKEWLLEHISGVDKKYTQHLLKSGIKKSWLRKFW